MNMEQSKLLPRTTKTQQIWMLVFEDNRTFGTKEGEQNRSNNYGGVALRISL